VPRYFFIVRRTETEEDDPHGTFLADDAAALHHAERTIGHGYRDPKGLIIVKNGYGNVVMYIPFLPGCA
jgi:hypothetical protein